jgi:hypothetical protein
MADLAEPEWWEITNREVNWDYLPELQKRQLPVFFSWFREDDLSVVPQREARR